MGALVEIKNLTRRFGPIVAVDGVSFNVDRGEVLGFLGPNGAGKSTTMKMVTGFLTPTSGTARVCGHDILTESVKVREKIGYLPEGAPAWGDMTPAGFFDFIADIRGYRGAEKKKRIDRAVELVGLQKVLHQPVDTLSKGFKRRVGLAQAILHDPEVLILDEPTDGLDPNQKHEVRMLIQEMAKDKVIILSTHILEEVDAVCTRAVIIARGKLIFDGTPAQLEARSRYYNAVHLTVPAAEAADVESALKAFDDVKSLERLESANGHVAFLLYPEKGKSLVARVSEAARANRWQVEEIRSEPGRLDEVFRELTLGVAGGDRT